MSIGGEKGAKLT